MRKRGRPPGGRRAPVVKMMLRLLAPFPSRPPVLRGPGGPAYAARKAAERYGLKYDTARGYYTDHLAAGGETPAQWFARRKRRIHQRTRMLAIIRSRKARKKTRN